MNELVKLGEKTYVIKSPVNVGIYILANNNVCLIDTGNSKDSAKIIAKILEEHNWHLQYIINTHSHADHIGGNKYLQDKYNCRIFSSLIESYFINEPMLEPSLLYGSVPPKDLHTHLLLAKPSVCENIDNMDIEGLEIINLEGHAKGLIGVVTSDNVCFVGDAYTSSKILNKYAIQYTFDVTKFLDTLNFLKTTSYNYYVPSHGEIESDIQSTIDANYNNMLEIENNVLNSIRASIKYTDLLNKLISSYHINLNMMQLYVVGTTIKSILTKLESEGKIELSTQDGDLLIKII